MSAVFAQKVTVNKINSPAARRSNEDSALEREEDTTTMLAHRPRMRLSRRRRVHVALRCRRKRDCRSRPHRRCVVRRDARIALEHRRAARMFGAGRLTLFFPGQTDAVHAVECTVKSALSRAIGNTAQRREAGTVRLRAKRWVGALGGRGVLHCRTLVLLCAPQNFERETTAANLVNWRDVRARGRPRALAARRRSAPSHFRDARRRGRWAACALRTAGRRRACRNSARRRSGRTPC